MELPSARQVRGNGRHAGVADDGWGRLYGAGGVAAGLIVLVIVLDIGLTFLPREASAEPGTLSAAGWFRVLQDNWFLGLRDLGLFNVVNMALSVPLFLALHAALRRVNGAYAALAVALQLVGSAIYIANNKGLALLALSGQYGAATAESQQVLLAAGQALLAQGEDFVPGSFMGFFFTGVAPMVMGAAMLQGRVFTRWTAWTGMLGPGALLMFTTWATFVRTAYDAAMLFAILGGLVALAWYVLAARRLFQLGRSVPEEEAEELEGWGQAEPV
jgi:hypothetical protein